MSNPSTPIKNLGVKYFNGCILQWASNTTMTIYPGEGRDNTDSNDIVISGDEQNPINFPPMTISVSSVGLNGMDSNKVANNTNYGVYIIGDSTKNKKAAAVISPSNFFPMLPGGYDIFRRAGFIRTDGSGNILKWFQYGRSQDRTYYYDVPLPVLTGGSATSFTSVPLDSGMPGIFFLAPGLLAPSSEVLLQITYTASNAANSIQFASNAGATTSILSFGSGFAGVQKTTMWVPTFGNQIFYKVTGTDLVNISVCGFKDYLSNPQ